MATSFARAAISNIPEPLDIDVMRRTLTFSQQDSQTDVPPDLRHCPSLTVRNAIYHLVGYTTGS
jgi:hypothetical protein